MRLKALPVLLLLLLLVGCQRVGPPELSAELTGTPLSNSNRVTTLTINNDGHSRSRLDWQLETTSSDLEFAPVTSGMLHGRNSLEVTVTAPSGRHVPMDTEVTINSNAGAEIIRPAATAGYDCMFTAAAPEVVSAGTPAFEPGELLVRYAGSPDTLPVALSGTFHNLQAASVRSGFELQLLARGAPDRPDLVSITGDPLVTARELEQDPRVLYAEPNYRLHLLGETVDCRENQWHLNRFGIPESWLLGEGRSEVVVAVIDSGVDVDHLELQAGMLPGFHFEYGARSANPRPGSASSAAAHGTHVAGIIAGLGLNAAGAVGAAPFSSVSVLPLRIFDASGNSALMSDLILALDWASGEPLPGVPFNEHPARIINLSIGSNIESSQALNEVLAALRQRGILVIAAAGNIPNGSPARGINAPANSPHALAVGSVNHDFKRSSFSEYGQRGSLSLMAPGGAGPSSCNGVLSTLPLNELGCMQGTSMAAPFVAAVAALILTHEPNLDVEELQARLEGATYYDPSFMSPLQYGFGVLCAERALSGENYSLGQPCSSH